jgi:hypothetical protein
MNVTDVIIDGIHYQYGDECEDGMCVWQVDPKGLGRKRKEFCGKHFEEVNTPYEIPDQELPGMWEQADFIDNSPQLEDNVASVRTKTPCEICGTTKTYIESADDIPPTPSCYGCGMRFEPKEDDV